MDTDRTVKFTVRLNMLNPAHVAINKVLSELDIDKPQYISTDDMEIIENES